MTSSVKHFLDIFQLTSSKNLDLLKKTTNQTFITVNEPIFFYLIYVNFFVYTFPCSNSYIKITTQKGK